MVALNNGVSHAMEDISTRSCHLLRDQKHSSYHCNPARSCMLANSGGVVSNGVLNSQSQKLPVNPSFDLGYTCSDEAKLYFCIVNHYLKVSMFKQ